MINQIDPIDLSKHIIQYFSEKNTEVNHLKLQKLIYYIDAWHNVYFNKPLIQENFEAWAHGPVVREVWNYYKGGSVLFDPLPVEEYVDIYVDKEQLDLINDVLEEYGDKTGYYLECLTHHEEPWRRARRGYAPGDKCEVIIDKDFAKEFYGDMLYGEKNS